MRILLINHYAGSERYGMEFRPYYLAREWAKAGHDATVLAATFSHLRKKNPQVERDFSEEEIAPGARFCWVKTPAYHSNGPMRMLNMTLFYQKVKRRARFLAEKYRPDAVIASSTYPMDIYLAQRIAQISGGRFYFEIHDLWPLSPVVLYHISEKNPMIRLLQRAEDFAFGHADKVLSVLPQADAHIRERGFDEKKFVYVPNGVVLDGEEVDITATPQYAAIRAEKEKGQFLCMYLGGFAKANALEDFVACAKELDEGVTLVMIGGGLLKEQFARQIKEENLSNILLLDPVEKRQVGDFLRLADCLYIGAKRCELYRYGVAMNKIFDYMLSARPVICGVEASNDPVGEAGCGVTIEAESPQAIARAIEKLRALPREELDAMGRRGRDYVAAHHDYEKLAQRFIDAIQ
ncbi:glycosyltransferase family 4 protein [Zongyangia hominis]|uniref:Glycosyltransferase family 4 protein n=1 Tax=Zongyangia hominis TaxID=2763677 RepID=A0A926ECY6_9FIRM|nr:glycosyltransferase family 4 protein [Zongyangia hominis]MBC8569472.1 glycosyltransferase family 4 protein [Zongyangia hominis]